MTPNVFIGYDNREHIAAEVCKFSIERRCPLSTNVRYLRIEDVPELTRPREEHQATDFTYTRFFVPYLSKYEGWSIFCDCDFLFRTDIRTVFQFVDQSKAVSVVQHPSYTPRTRIKMDGVLQAPLFRKNWASFIVFNNAHPAVRTLTPEFINSISPGRELHNLSWLKDEEIGRLPLEWNCLDDYYYLTDPKAIHYTDGGPWFDGYTNTTYSHLWKNEYNEYCNHKGLVPAIV